MEKYQFSSQQNEQKHSFFLSPFTISFSSSISSLYFLVLFVLYVIYTKIVDFVSDFLVGNYSRSTFIGITANWGSFIWIATDVILISTSFWWISRPKSLKWVHGISVLGFPFFLGSLGTKKSIFLTRDFPYEASCKLNSSMARIIASSTRVKG